MKLIRAFFPKKCPKPYTKFGFMKGEQYEDVANTKVIGFLSDFRLPENHLEIIIREVRVDPSFGFMGYVPKNRSIPENVPPLFVSMNTDNLVRRIIRDPIVYTNEKVYTESIIGEKGNATFTIDILIYVGQKRVIVCVPSFLLDYGIKH